MSQLTPEQAHAALNDIDRHIHHGRAAALLPTPVLGILSLAVFVNFASGDLPEGWARDVTAFSPVLVLIPILLASRIPALGSALGIRAVQRNTWRPNVLNKRFLLYMAGFLALLILNGSVGELPAVEDAVVVPHTIFGALTAVYMFTTANRWGHPMPRNTR